MTGARFPVRARHLLQKQLQKLEELMSCLSLSHSTELIYRTFASKKRGSCCVVEVPTLVSHFLVSTENLTNSFLIFSPPYYTESYLELRNQPAISKSTGCHKYIKL